jgi:activator of HSP90 ATPase
MMLNIFCVNGQMFAIQEGIMSHEASRAPQQSQTSRVTRRRILAGGAVSLGAIAAGSAVAYAQQAMTEKKSTGDEAKITSLHQEIDLKAEPHRVYTILLDSKQFAAFTGGRAATIDPTPGGAFKMFGGMIEGRNVELVPDVRIVQAWRPASWDAGVYSIAEFQLKAQAGGTKLILDHKGFPEGDFAHLDPGWHMQYWEPLVKYLG